MVFEGVLPLGKSNTLAKALFPGGERLGEVRSLADAALAIVEEVLKPVDVMKIQVLEESETGESKCLVHVSCVAIGKVTAFVG